tara:strand:- start:1122 stop:1238 length:117 start_codon:yes stop_codon:yes gene_type:complete
MKYLKKQLEKPEIEAFAAGIMLGIVMICFGFALVVIKG